ncbi:hypothetical protein V2J09_023648 [Rumex salicifolius]
MALYCGARPIISLPLNPSIYIHKLPKPCHLHQTMSGKTNAGVDLFASTKERKLPILLFDVMDTIVRDPFFEDIPAFFGMPFKELIECKHPTAWLEFETGLIDEDELARKFFKDERKFDLEGLKSCMKRGYAYLDGMEEMLDELNRKSYEIHAFTNYPIWYEMIEEKLKLSSYLDWTFCSFIIGKRKPDPDFYKEVFQQLEVDPGNCIFIDDRMKNVEAAISVGMNGLQFKSAALLRQDLFALGVDLSSDEVK